jgi:hypothetical protein
VTVGSPETRFVFVALACAALGACDGCHGKDEHAKDKAAPIEKRDCRTSADCGGETPCASGTCSDGRCVTTFTPAGQSCDNDTVCDGVARCDGKGQCHAEPPPQIDDGNPCTVDSCDPVSGVSHVPVAVDDGDPCTDDACNPVNGEITHKPVDVDDGDDCTFDSCDPKTGPKHDRPNAFYSCDSSCGEGFHAASRRPDAHCGSNGALQTFCVPSCGPSYYACDASCAAGYHASARTAGSGCGSGSPLQTFCEKNGESAFYSCDSACPEGYRQEPGSPGAHCGTSSTSIHCIKLGS